MAEFSRTSQALGLVGWLLVTFAAACVGAAASPISEELYREMIRPSWAPPAAVFGPIWTAIYVTIAFAAWTVWRTAGFAGAWEALWLYLIQLVPNALWSWLFFTWDLGALAFANSLLLLTLVICTTLSFRRVKTVASVLMLPYLVWVTYAVFLNFSIWQLNP